MKAISLKGFERFLDVKQFRNQTSKDRRFDAAPKSSGHSEGSLSRTLKAPVK
jgi:hypothetical protein